MQSWIENPSALQKALTSALIQRQNDPRLTVFQTIKLGVGPTDADGFRRYLKDAGISIDTPADDIMSKPEFTVSAEEREVDLVLVSATELGFKKGARQDQTYQRAKEFGLELCPPDVGPQLRLQYRDQPRGEWLVIGMEPITDSDGDPGVFSVGHQDKGLWLSSYWRIPDNGVWCPYGPWVFVRPRK